MASWSGWEIHARTPKYDYFVTILRRKYVPPTMDTFVDFICVSKYVVGEASTAVEEDRKDNPKHISPDNNSPFSEKLKEHRRLIDSVAPKDPNQRIYRSLIQERVNALLLDPETLDFFRYDLGLQPS